MAEVAASPAIARDLSDIRMQARNLFVVGFLVLFLELACIRWFAAYHTWSGLVVDVGGQRSPQEVFFGTEYRDPDIARFVVPIEVIAALFFVLIALMFVGPGQVLGRAFDAYPNRVLGYTLNIGGSLAGIVAFSVLAFLQAPAGVWFLIACAAVGYLQYQAGSLDRVKV